MSQIPGTGAKPRSYNEFMVQDLMGKLRSKDDFYDYLDKHSKYIFTEF